MTQVIACSTCEGIVLATDSCATWFDQTGVMRHFSLKKLLRLTSHSALISGGAGCKFFLIKRSAVEEEVGPPFYFATLTPAGYKEIVEKEIEG